ncbi:MAG: YbbR-like domain-containing protein [Bacteroidales bacterium]|nr:YbbR-like domain-containing protein [Bacteroidales bacterium]MCM1146982.1 YbbR-like domain-containing protein [Bacteroidales bacterium]MCM1205885.1 YbbR-like domain-containing protein [Bacillota bacterium]MCM1509874.1 YbbR-like domain-containing protein [Clostridium sp.]
MSVLNDTMERELRIPVQLTGVPANVVVLVDSMPQIRAVVRDKGFVVATYLFRNQTPPVKIPFSAYSKSSDKIAVTSSELQKLVTQQLSGSTKLVSLKPDKLEFAYNHGKYKRVPVKVLGVVSADDSYYLARVQFRPEYVTVYGSAQILDSITAVYTERQDIRNVRDTLSTVVRMRSVPGTKIVPEKVRMTLYPDVMVEATTSVPIIPTNVPVTKTLRTFPSQVDVSYVIGASQYKKLGVSQFTVIADYNTTADGTAEKCNLRIIRSPRDAHNVRLAMPSVDYLIEQ